METGKNDKILAIIIGAAGLAVLAVTVFGVLLWGPLEPVLRNTRTLLMMAEVVLVFFWNLFCLAGGRGKKPGTGSHRGVRALGLAAGIVLFTWCHRIFLPLAVSQLIGEKKATVTVLTSPDKWYGVTYAADKPAVVAALRRMTDEGKYPNGLWK